MTPTAYVAGPMSGLPEYNYPAFFAAAKQLRSEGWIVENPASNDLDTSKPREYYLRMAAAQVARCTAVFLLPGWRKSRGVTEMELPIAYACGLEVFEYETRKPPARESAIELASKITSGARREAYGPAIDNFTNTAQLWTPILASILKPGAEVTAKQVGLCMIALKISREIFRHSPDNFTDMIGYAHLLDSDDRFHKKPLDAAT